MGFFILLIYSILQIILKIFQNKCNLYDIISFKIVYLNIENHKKMEIMENISNIEKLFNILNEKNISFEIRTEYFNYGSFDSNIILNKTIVGFRFSKYQWIWFDYNNKMDFFSFEYIFDQINGKYLKGFRYGLNKRLKIKKQLGIDM